jgi:predicted dehydrogenase
VRRNGARPTIEGGPIPVDRDEPLKRELADVVQAVRTGRTPCVDGAAGRRALALATEIADRMESVA